MLPRTIRSLMRRGLSPNPLAGMRRRTRIRALPEKSRCFLIKRARNSVVAQLDLDGLAEAIAVLSGSTETVRMMEAAINESGEEAAAWLPVFHRRRAAGNNSGPRAGDDNGRIA